MSLQEDIKKYVADNMENAFDLAKAFQMSKDLVLYGETHAGLEKKARFFARLINAKHVRYHASEHFLNTKEYGDKVTKYLKGEISKSGLPSGIRPLAVILDAIKIDIKTRGIVFAGTTVKNSERRHERLHYHFTSSYNLNIKEGRFTKTDKGHFHIGAFHAARLPQQGSAKTTTQLLTDDGFDCGVVRILVDYGGTASVGRQGMTVVPGEYDLVEPVAGGEKFKLLPLLREKAGGNAFGVDLQIKRNPFFKIKRKGLENSNSFSHYFDKLIYIP